ncbi:MAG: TPM domain-containing protein, partial [Nitrospiraceae bacterium]
MFNPWFIAAVRLVCVIAFVCLFLSGFGFALDVPQLTGRIVDRAELLSPDAEASLSADLAAYEQRTGNQIAVLTLSSLDGESLEEYSHRVATAWKLGQKGQDNGVLLLVVPRERRLRIEVGYGLEGALTDAASSRIIRNVIVPYFRTGDFTGGITAGLKAVIDVLERTGAPPDVL